MLQLRQPWQDKSSMLLLTKLSSSWPTRHGSPTEARRQRLSEPSPKTPTLPLLHKNPLRWQQSRPAVVEGAPEADAVHNVVRAVGGEVAIKIPRPIIKIIIARQTKIKVKLKPTLTPETNLTKKAQNIQISQQRPTGHAPSIGRRVGVLHTVQTP